MANLRRRTKINKAIVAVTGVASQDIIPAASGYSYGLTKIIAANLDGTTAQLTLLEGGEKLYPPFTIGASGTLFLDDPEVEIPVGSGVAGRLTSAGTEGVEVCVNYIIYDDRTPISKEQARAATYVASRAIRTPNQFGGQ